MNLSDINLEGIDWVKNLRREWEKVQTETSTTDYFTIIGDGNGDDHPPIQSTGTWTPENGLECISCAAIYNQIKSDCDTLTAIISQSAIAETKKSKQPIYAEKGSSSTESRDTLYLYEIPY